MNIEIGKKGCTVVWATSAEVNARIVADDNKAWKLYDALTVKGYKPVIFFNSDAMHERGRKDETIGN